MIIVSGWLRVDAAERERYLDSCLPSMEAARQAPGCIDFHLSPDPLESDRINVFEQWSDVASVERFRGEGPSDDLQRAILDARVDQHEIASTRGLT